MAMNIGQIIGAITGLGSLFGASSASKSASSAAGAQKEALAQQKEWLDKIWKYYEPELQRKQQMQTMLDPYRNQASSWLGALTGMKTPPQYGGTPPVSPPTTTPVLSTPGVSSSTNLGGSNLPSWMGSAGRSPIDTLRNILASSARTVTPELTGAAAGIGGSPSWAGKSPLTQWQEATTPRTGVPQALPVQAAPTPGAGWAVDTRPVGSAGPTTPLPPGVTVPRPIRPGSTPAPTPVAPTPTAPTPVAPTPTAPTPTAPTPVAPTPAAPASPASMPVGGLSEQQAAIAAAKPTGENAPPWYFQVPQLSAPLQSALQGTPDWQQPFTPQQQGALTNLSDVNISDQYNQRNTAMQQMLARRGLGPVGGTSSMDTSAQVGLQNWLQNQQANQQAQMSLAGMARGDQLRSENLGNLMNQQGLEAGQRGEGRGNYSTLLIFLTSQAAAQPDASSLYGGVSGYGNVASGYGNIADMYGNMATSSGQNLGNILAQLFGNQGGNNG